MELEDESDSPIPKVRLFTFRQVKDILAVEVYRPGRGTIECSDNMKQRAFSCSRSPDNGNQLPTLNL